MRLKGVRRLPTPGPPTWGWPEEYKLPSVSPGPALTHPEHGLPAGLVKPAGQKHSDFSLALLVAETKNKKQKTFVPVPLMLSSEYGRESAFQCTMRRAGTRDSESSTPLPFLAAEYSMWSL